MNRIILSSVAVVAVAGFAGSLGLPAAQAQTGGRWVLVYTGYVMERDSSNAVYFQGRTIYRGQRVSGIPVNGTRQSWTNSQGYREWVTLRPGTQVVDVDRQNAASSRALVFYCYQWQWRR